MDTFKAFEISLLDIESRVDRIKSGLDSLKKNEQKDKLDNFLKVLDHELKGIQDQKKHIKTLKGSKDDINKTRYETLKKLFKKSLVHDFNHQYARMIGKESPYSYHFDSIFGKKGDDIFSFHLMFKEKRKLMFTIICAVDFRDDDKQIQISIHCKRITPNSPEITIVEGFFRHRGIHAPIDPAGFQYKDARNFVNGLN